MNQITPTPIPAFPGLYDFSRPLIADVIEGSGDLIAGPGWALARGPKCWLCGATVPRPREGHPSRVCSRCLDPWADAREASNNSRLRYSRRARFPEPAWKDHWERPDDKQCPTCRAWGTATPEAGNPAHARTNAHRAMERLVRETEIGNVILGGTSAALVATALTATTDTLTPHAALARWVTPHGCDLPAPTPGALHGFVYSAENEGRKGRPVLIVAGPVWAVIADAIATTTAMFPDPAGLTSTDRGIYDRRRAERSYAIMVQIAATVQRAWPKAPLAWPKWFFDGALSACAKQTMRDAAGRDPRLGYVEIVGVNMAAVVREAFGIASPIGGAA